MATTPIQKYERILDADPRSRVFVELARALLDGGEPARAVEVCRRGLEHHPDSVQARVLWARALLALGAADEAVARLEEAVRVDPRSAYGYELAGEVLVGAGLAGSARGILEEGAKAHPGDGRIARWLMEARAASPGWKGEEGEGASTSTSFSSPVADEVVRPERSDATASQSRRARTPTPSSTSTSPGADGASAAVAAKAAPPVLHRPPPLRRPAAPEIAEAARVLDLLPDVPVAPPADAPVPLPSPSTMTPAHGVPAARDEEAEAEAAARTYEHELREKLRADEPQPGFVRRHARALVAAAVAVTLL
ncbi:MAG TPA: tetratricopeptide repeat protein, partial [Anaeromyxobacteraceae bacterium]|nr:tetratricopeptide repeat protein [Anaeromyxobacteraceae bacterium]